MTPAGPDVATMAARLSRVSGAVGVTPGGRLGTTPAELTASLAAAPGLVAGTAQNGGHGTAGQSADGSG